ncbi:hypothetical protein HNQ94_002252 [Salirhabdus euzebyi]|uniref:DUF2680 domain-containing protein n=1 Tax=Salirhabdus euzebyi TaxID=394506 RepID=A0A841Q5Y2_9BACI|nr:DUF2680 domain-containing protein [Salirhabdus euzebyi]MBB6453801.1 hypothetical protein [Salirhabdus euzebyi]
MKKILSICMVSLLSFSVMFNINIHAEDTAVEKPNVELKEDQKKVLDQMYGELLEKHKQIIEKYVEFGLMSKEEADKKFERLQQFHEKLKESGYVPNWEHGKKEKEKYHKNKDQ